MYNMRFPHFENGEMRPHFLTFYGILWKLDNFLEKISESFESCQEVVSGAAWGGTNALERGKGASWPPGIVKIPFLRILAIW